MTTMATLGFWDKWPLSYHVFGFELSPADCGGIQTPWANMWPVPINDLYYKPIEKATSMTLKQFYDTFRQPTDKCIETPAKLWPTPEP